MKRPAIIFTTALLAATLALLPACASESAQNTESGTNTTVDTEAMRNVVGTPPLQPADHADRAQDPASRCYGCHGAGSKANPQLKDATLLPEDHYVDGTYESRKITPTREQCITCHPAA